MKLNPAKTHHDLKQWMGSFLYTYLAWIWLAVSDIHARKLPEMYYKYSKWRYEFFSPWLRCMKVFHLFFLIFLFGYEAHNKTALWNLRVACLFCTLRNFSHTKELKKLRHACWILRFQDLAFWQTKPGIVLLHSKLNNSNLAATVADPGINSAARQSRLFDKKPK